MTGAAAPVSPGEYKSITPEHVIARIRTGKTEGPEFEEELARQKQAYEDAAYRSGWAGTAAQVAALAPLPIAKVFGAGKPLLNTMATGGAVGGAAAAGNEQDPLMGMATGAAGGAGGYYLGKGISFVGDKVLGALGKVLPVGPLKVPPKKPPMTKADFKKEATAAYDEAKSHGVIFNKQGIQQLKDNIEKDLADRVYDPDNEPGIAPILRRLNDYAQRGNVTFEGLEALRKLASNGYRLGNKSNNALVYKVIDRIEELNNNMDPNFVASASGNPKAAQAAQLRARKAFATSARLQTVDDLLEVGRLQGRRNISQNVAERQQAQLTKILDPTSSRGRGFTPTQKAAVEQAALRTGKQALAQSISGMVPRGKLATAVHAAPVMAGLIGGGFTPLGALAAVAGTGARIGIGIAAEKWAARLAQKSVNEMIHVIATGQSSKQAVQSALQKLTASKRQAVMEGLAKAGYSLAAATQPLNETTGKKAQ